MIAHVQCYKAPDIWCLVLSGGAVLLDHEREDGAFATGMTVGHCGATIMCEDVVELQSRDHELSWLSTNERRERRRAFRATCRAAPHIFDTTLGIFVHDA